MNKITDSEMVQNESDTLTQSVPKNKMDTTEGDTLTPKEAFRAPMKLASEQQIYEAFYLIGRGLVSISARKIAKATGLRITKFTSLQKKYVLAKLLGTNEEENLRIVLNAFSTCSIPLEYHFSSLTIQDLLNMQKLEYIKFFLCLDGNFLKFINISCIELQHLNENAIKNKLEAISRRYRISFCHNTQKGENYGKNN